MAAAARQQYFPQDARAKLVRAMKLDVRLPDDMPLVEDDTKVSRKPPLRPVRDEYNAHTPLTLLSDEGHCVWLMCARRAAWDAHLLLENGISAVLCCARGSEARRRHRSITYLDMPDMNDVVEGVVDVSALTAAWVKLRRLAVGGGGVGIHCRNGANRSPIAAAAYMMGVDRRGPCDHH